MVHKKCAKRGPESGTKTDIVSRGGSVKIALASCRAIAEPFVPARPTLLGPCCDHTDHARRHKRRHHRARATVLPATFAGRLHRLPIRPGHAQPPRILDSAAALHSAAPPSSLGPHLPVVPLLLLAQLLRAPRERALGAAERALGGACTGKALLTEALAAGTAASFFGLIAQFRTQNEPAFCGLGTLVRGY